jgi:uncharacterized caspase-like protein
MAARTGFTEIRRLFARRAGLYFAARSGLFFNALRWCLAAFLLAVPSQAFNAVSYSPVNTLPRFALVIGNSRYAEAPLINPRNDANAIAEQLRRSGFTVTLKLDATRKEMLETIQSFGANLAKQKYVGLFYFAGHGAQLAWHNYLIPVDAQIEQFADMQTQAVDLTTLLNSLTRAANPMNVIILDACRDNPFGKGVGLEQKGLSQIDAPPGTLLAYATSPGSVAADGSGSNGLYTEYLLKEMQSQDAKIEDVFKRVRLYVRRRSGGQQIPWESTSLEEDFYLFPPAQIKKLTPEEAEKQFEEELAIWETIKSSKESAPLENYLRRFPSGKFSELAQFRLDRLLAQQEELARAEAELKKQQELAKAEAERKQQEEIARAEAERNRLDALAKAETERKRLEELARAEVERKKREDLAQAKAERKRQEQLARAEAEVRKQQELAKAEADRKQQQELARAEAELKKQQELAKAEAQRKQQEEIVRAEAERKRQDALAKAEIERKRLEELARAETERKKKQELAKTEADRKQQQQFTLAQSAAMPAPAAAPHAASIAPNPFSRGSAKVDANYHLGDRYSYRVIDTLTQLETQQHTNRVTGVTDSEVIYNDGRIVRDLLGNAIKPGNGNQVTGQQYFVSEYSIGKKWTTRYRFVKSTSEERNDVEIDFKVVAREMITVPAGTFDAFKVEGRGYNMGHGSYLEVTYWIAPDKVRRPIVIMEIWRNKHGKFTKTDRSELVAYRQSD